MAGPVPSDDAGGDAAFASEEGVVDSDVTGGGTFSVSSAMLNETLRESLDDFGGYIDVTKLLYGRRGNGLSVFVSRLDTSLECHRLI